MRTRLDKWLWCARFYRTRVLAQEACARGAIRINGVRTVKAHYLVGAGDVLTFGRGGQVRVVRVLGLAERRGSARDAAALFEDLSKDPTPGPVNPSIDPGSNAEEPP